MTLLRKSNAPAMLTTCFRAAAHAHGGELSMASQGRKVMCDWGTCSRLPGDSLEHASSICRETNNWEKDVLPGALGMGMLGNTAEPCILPAL